MDRPDPFFGYALVLRSIVFAAIPAFLLWQFVRLRRALHIFQLEGYKSERFLRWCRSEPQRALFLRSGVHKKPLVMTGRAIRLLVVSLALTTVLVIGLPAAAHLAAGAPFDLIVWGVVTLLLFFGAPVVLVVSDWLLAPVQAAINEGYTRRARAKLDRVAPVVIGVTGSFGKTSTKFAIQGILSALGPALATPGSFNTPMGVTRAINENLDDRHRFFIVEMGAYREGDIAELCSFVRPTVGVLTAVGPAHLERFGSLEAIRRAKYELIRSLPSHGIAVMKSDDPEVRALADATTEVQVVRYGREAAGAPDVTATEVQVTPDGTSCTIVDARSGSRLDARTRLLGRHALGHVLAAIAVALACGARLEDLAPALAELKAPEHRLQIVEGTGGVTVIDDAYNSNPEGAAAALEVLDAMPARRKVIVTPGIVELGDLQREENERFGQRAGAIADTVIVVAPVNRDAVVAGARRGGRADVVAVDSLGEATARLQTILAPGDVVLFENDLPDQYER